MEKEKDTTREVKTEENTIKLQSDPPKVTKGVVLKPPTANLGAK